MRRITILFFVSLILVLLYFPVRYWLAQPPDPGVLVVPAPLEKSYYEMLKEKEGLNRPEIDVRPWTRPWWDQ